jgi:hypothetical protein
MSKNIKQWYKSKTVWIAIIQFVLGGVISMTQIYPEVGWVFMIKSMLDVSLRFLTYEEIK